MANYICPAVGDCEHANKNEIFERTPGDDLHCPKCGTILEMTKTPTPTGGTIGPSKSIIAVISAVVVLAIAGGATYYYSYYKKAHGPGNDGSAQSATGPGGLAPSDQEITKQSQDAAGKLVNGNAGDATTASKSAAAKEMIKAAVADMKQGKLDDAERDLNDAAAQDPKQPLVYYDLGVLRLKQGRTDEALKQFEASFLNGFTSFDQMDQDPDLDGIRNDPRFTALLKKYRPSAT